MKNYHNHYLLLIVETICLTSFPFILIFLLYKNNFLFYVYAMLSILFITKLGQSIAQHRYFSHRSFKTNKITETILGLAATLSTTGSILHYSLIHRYHHTYSDTEKDMHSPANGDSWRIWFGMLDTNKTSKLDPRKIKDLLGIKSVKFFQNYYWPTIVLYVFILYLADPILVILCYMLPVGYSKFCTGIQGTLNHKIGYRNFDTNDNSTNNLILNIITLGEGSHNNHHYNQGNYNFGFTGKIKEFDFSAFIIKTFLENKKNDQEDLI